MIFLTLWLSIKRGITCQPGSITEDLAIKKGTVDQFFYTVVYVIFVYMMALSCFKLIDPIPGEILRWIGSDAKNIIDAAGDDTAGLVQRFYVGSFGMPLVRRIWAPLARRSKVCAVLLKVPVKWQVKGLKAWFRAEIRGLKVIVNKRLINIRTFIA